MSIIRGHLHRILKTSSKCKKLIYIVCFYCFYAYIFFLMILSLKLVEGPGFKRKIGFECEPIRFKATGTLESPNLVVEYDNEDLKFLTAIGDLIMLNKNNAEENNNNNMLICKEKVYKNQFSLLNNSLAAVEFSLQINRPFYIQNLKEKYLLKPKSKLKVYLIIINVKNIFYEFS
jgi:hypothetical protein